MHFYYSKLHSIELRAELIEIYKKQMLIADEAKMIFISITIKISLQKNLSRFGYTIWKS